MKCCIDISMFTVNVEIFVCIQFRGFTKIGKKREYTHMIIKSSITKIEDS